MKYLLIILSAFLFVNSCPAQTKISPDDYPVTNEMFKGNYGEKTSGEIVSLDKAWFTNDTLKQTLVFELYTDYHRLVIYQFYNDTIPGGLVDRVELNVETNPRSFGIASSNQKQRYFKGFIKSGNKISQRYFTTLKGFSLGDKNEKAINIYGKPDVQTVSDGFEKCEWKFKGDITQAETGIKTKSNKPIAKNSFGYSVTMFFKNEKLMAMIIHNAIP